MESLKQKTMGLAQTRIKGWVPVSISEKKLSGGAKAFLVAFRKPEHAHLPFDTKDRIPNLALCYIWVDNDNYTDMPIEQLRDFTNNAKHPSISDIVQVIRTQQQVLGSQN